MFHKLFLKSAASISMMLLVLLIAWIPLMIITSLPVQANWTFNNYLNWLQYPHPIYWLNYLNASLLTLLVVIMFGSIYIYTRDEKNEVLALGSFMLVPVYAAINFVVYAFQFTVLPHLMRQYDRLEDGLTAKFMIMHMIHLADGSAAGMINSLAYGLLGIPSMVFGILLMNKNRYGRAAGILLIISAFINWSGTLGMILGIRWMQYGMVLGGLIFTLAVLFIFLMYRKDAWVPEEESELHIKRT